MVDPLIVRVVEALRPVEGLTALVLGGSRGRGTAGPASDYDIGLYYEPDAPFDVEALRSAIAPLVDDPSATVTRFGEWGPWINGGGWLTIEGREVDLLYRDLGRVHAVIADAQQGLLSMSYQPGHPHGFCSTIWMGEVATCQPLFDPSGRIAELKRQTWPYPAALKNAVISRFGWEVDFAIDNAEIAVRRAEQTHIAGCAYRALSPKPRPTPSPLRVWPSPRPRSGEPSATQSMSACCSACAVCPAACVPSSGNADLPLATRKSRKKSGLGKIENSCR